jgi:hypothetical protein
VVGPEPGLAKLLPGKLFSPTTVGGYYDENRRGMSIEPELTAELGPERIERRQPGRLLRVRLSAKNDESGVRSRFIATNLVSIRAVWSRFGNEDAACASRSLNLWRARLQFLINRNSKMLPNQEFGHFEVVVSLPEPSRIVALDREFPTKRERDQHEHQEEGEEPPKRGRIAHVSHLAR